MEYEFLAEDGKRYMESDAAPHSTPKVGDYITVMYHRDRPTNNLPKRQFWFLQWSPVEVELLARNRLTI